MACRVMCAAGPSMARHSLEMKPSSSSAVQVEMASRAGGALMPMHLADPPCSLAFVYGTLKQGCSNHWLIEVSAPHAELGFASEGGALRGKQASLLSSQLLCLALPFARCS
jgi:hypothetical protein